MRLPFSRATRVCTRERERRKIELNLFSVFSPHPDTLGLTREDAENSSATDLMLQPIPVWNYGQSARDIR
jgi:hypothetical protein